MPAAVIDQTSPNASSSGRPAAVNRLRIATWHEEAFTITVTTVRDLSAGIIRRDPYFRPPQRFSKPETIIIGRRGPVFRSRYHLNLQKRAVLTGKTVEELQEEERLRGERRRKERKAKEAKHE